jgi:hypothetical protein
MASIYQHIAESNPDGCVMLLHKYGYATTAPMNTIDDVAYCTQQMIACEGEPAFKDLLKLHPDRDVIIEDYNASLPQATQTTPQPIPAPTTMNMCGSGCSCGNCSSGSMKNATGDTSGSSSVATQTGTFILLGAVFIAVAILTAK